MMKKNRFFNILKFFIALVIGGFLGDKLLAPGNPLYVLLFLLLCYIGGVILYNVGPK